MILLNQQSRRDLQSISQHARQWLQYDDHVRLPELHKMLETDVFFVPIRVVYNRNYPIYHIVNRLVLFSRYHYARRGTERFWHVFSPRLYVCVVCIFLIQLMHLVTVLYSSRLFKLFFCYWYNPEKKSMYMQVFVFLSGLFINIQLNILSITLCERNSGEWLNNSNMYCMPLCT